MVLSCYSNGIRPFLDRNVTFAIDFFFNLWKDAAIVFKKAFYEIIPFYGPCVSFCGDARE